MMFIAKREKYIVKSLIVMALLCGSRAGALGQTDTSRLFEERFGGESPFGTSLQKLSYLDKGGKPLQPGKPFSEILRGNGTRAGYILSHGGIIPSSVSVSVGARLLRPNVDYYLDAANGTLFFTEPVRRIDSIRVFYRYVEGQDSARSPVTLPGFSLRFKGTAFNFAYGLSAGNGMDFTTYGLSVNSTFGRGSTLQGLLYFSTPAGNSQNMVGETRASLLDTRPKPNPEDAKSDRLVLQNLRITSGPATFRATYQDVGLKFNGFQAMRQANANNPEVLAQIATLEKEKGIQRLGFGAGVQVGKTENVGLDWDQINDGKDRILRQSIGYTSPLLRFRYNFQSIGPQFSLFKGLREAEAAQWAREKGIRRSELSLGLLTGKNGQLSFYRNSIGDKSGRLTGQSLEYAGSAFRFSLSNREVTSSFSRLNDLSDADKTALALDIRRQFNPTAADGEVTAKDRQQIVSEAGLSRTRMAFSVTMGKEGLLGYNTFHIGDGKGSIRRNTLDLRAQNFTLSYLDQDISDTFSRLGSMSDFEKSQFGNERGIHRNLLGFQWTLNKSSSLAFSQLRIDDKEGGLLRQSLAYTGKGVDVKLNLGNTDKTFTRVGDLAGLSKEERAVIEAERGYKRMDFAANLTAWKGFTFNTYIYDASNRQDKLSKDIFRHFLSWIPNPAIKVTYLSEGNSFSQAGRTQEGRTHSLLTYDQILKEGMKINFYQDNLETIAAGKALPTATTSFFHFETDRSKANNFMAETKRMHMSNGKFENTIHLDMNYRLFNNLGLRFTRFDVDRGADPSAETNVLQWNWQVSKTILFNGTLSETNTNNDHDSSAKSFALVGPILPNLNFSGSYSEVVQKKKTRGVQGNVKSEVDVAFSNAKPFHLFGLKETMLTFKYASLNDQRKQVSQTVAGRVQGMIGKNRVALEYGGSLDPKGNSHIARTISLVSDRNEKLPVHYDMTYTAHNVNRSKLLLERKYHFVARIDKRTNFKYAYASLPLNVVNNQPQPLTTEALSLKSELTPTLHLSVDYNEQHNLGTKEDVHKLGVLISGKMDPHTAVQVGYSVDIFTRNGQHVDAHTITLGYDKQIDGDHFLVLQTAYTRYNKSETPDAVQANLDFKTRF
jgi:hypothetical protein